MSVKLSIIILLIANATIVYSQNMPYPPSPVVKNIEFDWSTHISLAPGSDNWPITWADDNKQYTVWGDGGGFDGTNKLGRSSIGVARLEGNWDDFKAFNVWGGHNSENNNNLIAKSYGIISIDGILYMWCGMFQTDEDQFDQAKIAYSDNHGATWEFVDWNFTREEGIMMPTVCNFDKNYENAKDDFVYTYLIWTKNLNERLPVFENPDGVGWSINVSYNSKLERYFLTTEHTESHRGNLGIFDAPEPWGPWTTVLYDNSWGEGFIPLNTFYWNFANKWLSKDGKNFSLIFTGRKENDSFNLIRGKFITDK